MCEDYQCRVQHIVTVLFGPRQIPPRRRPNGSTRYAMIPRFTWQNTSSRTATGSFLIPIIAWWPSIAVILLSRVHQWQAFRSKREHVSWQSCRTREVEASGRLAAPVFENDHGAVKEHLNRLSRMDGDNSRSLETVREFRELVVRHASDKEETKVPAHRAKHGSDDMCNSPRQEARPVSAPPER